MADIFISYASVDRPTAHRLAEALEARSWSVWWDHRNLRGGQHFDRIIEDAISTARVVIVVWSQNSIKSDWVRAEAAKALDEKKLVPLRIDMAVLPLRFRNIHTIDLSSWTESTEAEPFETFIETLTYYLGPSSSSNRSEQPGTRTEPSFQAAPPDGSRQFSVRDNQQPAETVPITDHPQAPPNSGSFHASVATEHRAPPAGSIFSVAWAREPEHRGSGRKRVVNYFATIVAIVVVLLSLVMLEGRQQAHNLSTEKTSVMKPTAIPMRPDIDKRFQELDQIIDGS